MSRGVGATLLLQLTRQLRLTLLTLVYKGLLSVVIIRVRTLLAQLGVLHGRMLVRHPTRGTLRTGRTLCAS